MMLHKFCNDTFFFFRPNYSFKYASQYFLDLSQRKLEWLQSNRLFLLRVIYVTMSRKSVMSHFVWTVQLKCMLMSYIILIYDKDELLKLTWAGYVSYICSSQEKKQNDRIQLFSGVNAWFILPTYLSSSIFTLILVRFTIRDAYIFV